MTSEDCTATHLTLPWGRVVDFGIYHQPVGRGVYVRNISAVDRLLPCEGSKGDTAI